MKVALTVWNGRISPVFDVCREALVAEVEDGSVASRSPHRFHDTEEDRAGRLAGMGVEALICGAISAPLYRKLAARDIEVIAFVAGDVDNVLAAFLAGRLSGRDFAMPGCCRRRRRIGRGRGQGRPGGCW